MAVGIPAKKAKFRFAQNFDGVLSIALGNDQLYMQYGSDEGKRYFKVFDLQLFTGDENDEPAQLVREVEAQWRPMFLMGNLLHIYGKAPELIDVTQWQVLYSEYNGIANNVTPKTAVSRCGDTLYVLAGNHALVVDLKTFVVAADFSYFNSHFMQALLAGSKYKNLAFPHYISASKDALVLSNSGSIGYVLCLSTTDGSLLWGRKSNWEMLAADTDGDLIFGLEERRPRAWDKFTDEEVWQASAGTIANTIEVSDNWVVFHQPAGDIQCFNWRKPYVSPSRPA